MATSTNAPARSRFIEHDGIRVILLDFHGITDPQEGLAAVAAAQKFIGALTPDGSHYTLTDVRQTRYDKQIVDAFKEFTQHNRPYVRAAAIVSDSALHRAAISMIGIVSRRKLAVFGTREEGLAYLAKEDAAAKQKGGR